MKFVAHIKKEHINRIDDLAFAYHDWMNVKNIKVLRSIRAITGEIDTSTLENLSKSEIVAFVQEQSRTNIHWIFVEKWIKLTERKPTEEGYYFVMYDDGEFDEKPYRIRPKQNIDGFMTEKNVLFWSVIPEERLPIDAEID